MESYLDDFSITDKIHACFTILKNNVATMPTTTLQTKNASAQMNKTYEPPHGKTNNVVSDQVRHKPVCAVTEAG